MNIKDGDNNMPNLIFNANEIEEQGKHTVNESGYLYVGRKYSGKEITWIKLKECKKKKFTKEQGSNTSTPK